MKNKVAFVVAAALCLTMTMPAFAAAETGTLDVSAAGSATIETPAQKEMDVTVDVDSSNLVHADDVFSVDITWDSLNFTYAFNNEDTTTWDPTTHSYISNDEYPFNVAGTWLRRSAGNEYSRTNSDIVVTNHSNADVSVAATFKDADDATLLTKTTNNVLATLKGASFTLATGEGRDFTEADANTFTVNVDGTPNVTDAFKLGTINVAITSVK